MNNKENKIKVILVQPHKEARVIEINNELKTMQKLVNGYIEMFTPFEDEVAIICNDEGKLRGDKPNRAIYTEPKKVEMTYAKLKEMFKENEKNGKAPLMGYIVFSPDSFDKEYSEMERTYLVSSHNKAFMPNMSGYSIYGTSLDGKDKMVRLEQYIDVEKGGKDGSKIEKCYIKDNEQRKLIDIIFGDFFICYVPADSEYFHSMPEDLKEKYLNLFKNPEF